MFMPDILVSEPDYVRIRNVLNYYHNFELENELERADIINCILVPSSLVTLDTKVLYIDHDENLKKESLLVLPHCPEGQDLVISVMSPVGTALLGLEAGEKITWKIDNKRKTLEVIDVIYQPETHGNLHPLTFNNEYHHLNNSLSHAS